jgi:hypothetical protein
MHFTLTLFQTIDFDPGLIFFFGHGILHARPSTLSESNVAAAAASTPPYAACAADMDAAVPKQSCTLFNSLVSPTCRVFGAVSSKGIIGKITIINITLKALNKIHYGKGPAPIDCPHFQVPLVMMAI